MTIWDDRILETLRNEGAMSVGKIAEREDIRVSHSSVSRRCSKLADHGLTIHLGNGVYDITEEGEGYLDEEYDAENGVWMRSSDENGAPTAGEEPGEI
jgi:Mn-dependent DtxR family transcriptional regulator